MYNMDLLLVRTDSVAATSASIYKGPYGFATDQPLNHPFRAFSDLSKTHRLAMLTAKAAPVFALFEMLFVLFCHSQEWFIRLAYGLRTLLLLADPLQSSRSLLLYITSTMH